MSEALIGGEQTGEGLENPPTDGLGQVAEQANGSGDDYWSRVASDPDFAREQIVKRDQHSSQLANRVKELEPIEHLVKLAGSPDALMDLVQMGNRVETTPGLKDVVLGAIQNGRYEPPQQQVAQNGQDDSDDEWIDPDVKKVRDSFRSELAELRNELSQIRQVAGSADLAGQERHVQENIERVLEEFRGDPEAYEEASNKIMTAYQNAYNAAQRGDANQAALVKQLASKEGHGILEAAVFPVYKKHAAKLVAARNTSTNQNVANLSRSTDERNTNPARPGAPQLPPLPNGMVGTNTVQSILEAAARNAGIDPRTL